MTKQACILILLLFWLLSGCVPVKINQMPGLPFIITLTPEPFAPGTPTLPLATEPAIPASPTSAVTKYTSSTPSLPSASETPARLVGSLTPSPTYIAFLPTATETLLSPLNLPTENPRSPTLAAWTGLPTYPGDSDPGLLFHLDYDPDIWAQTEGNFGDIVLASRQIEYCTISPWVGRGSPIDWKVSHESHVIGSIFYDINTVLSEGEIKFVSYVGGDTHVLTGFQVTFNLQQDQCLQDAENILGTLRSLAASPTITPIPVPTTPTP